MYSQTHYHISQLLKWFGNVKKPTLIDYGCGSGDILSVLRPSQLQQYYGFDVNKNSLKALTKKTKAKNISIHHVNTNRTLNLGEVKSIDAVISVGVLQYMSDEQIDELFKEVHRVLKKNGVFIFSCAHDKILYKALNLYGLLLPNRYFSRSTVKSKLTNSKLSLKYLQARGPLLNPLFSYFLVFFFDAIDKVLFKTKGTIGPVGRFIRKVSKPILDRELDLNANVGYTLFVVATK